MSEKRREILATSCMQIKLLKAEVSHLQLKMKFRAIFSKNCHTYFQTKIAALLMTKLLLLITLEPRKFYPSCSCGVTDQIDQCEETAHLKNHLFATNV